MAKRAIDYARVSTDEQAEKGYSLLTQLQACKDYAVTNGFDVVAEISDDCSGAKLDRPGLDIIRGMFDKRQAEVLIVYTADRLSRNLAHSLILRDELQKAGIELHYVSRGRSEDTPEGRMIENIEGVIAEFEREKIRERTRRGKVSKAKAGKWVGAGHLAYGYCKVGEKGDTHISLQEEEAPIVKQIFNWYLGVGKQKPLAALAIARRLTERGVTPPNRGKVGRGWHVSRIVAILRNRNYLGEFRSMGQPLRFPELALIDEGAFAAAQARVEKNKNLSRRNRKRQYLLTGHLRCICGSAMCGHVGNGYTYYVCTAYRSRRHVSDCREKAVRSEPIEKALWAWLSHLLQDDEQLQLGMSRMAARLETEITPKRARLAAISSLVEKSELKIRRLMSAFANEDDETVAVELRAAVKTASKEKEMLEVERNGLELDLAQQTLSEEDKAAVLETAAQIRQGLVDPDFDTKLFVLDRLDVHAQLHRDETGEWFDVSCAIGSTVLMGKCDSAVGLMVTTPRRQFVILVISRHGWQPHRRLGYRDSAYCCP